MPKAAKPNTRVSRGRLVLYHALLLGGDQIGALAQQAGLSHISFATQNPLQFQDALTRNNDLLRLHGAAGIRQRRFCNCQTMTVSRYCSQHFAVCFQQSTVQVVANILLCH